MLSIAPSSCVPFNSDTTDAVDALATTCAGNTPQETIKNALKMIAKQKRVLNKLGSHLRDAANGLKKGAHSAKLSDITLRLLNGVLVHFTGQKLARAEKKTTDGPILFAIKVLELADPQIKNPKATVQTFIKKGHNVWPGAIAYLEWFAESKKSKLIYK
jgi:hypothetical protein